MMQYSLQEVCVLPMQNMQDIIHMHMQLRHLYHADQFANCHALSIASYINFKNDCIRAIEWGGGGTVHASLPDGYRLEYHNGNVIIRQLTFKVCGDDSVDDPMDI